MADLTPIHDPDSALAVLCAFTMHDTVVIRVDHLFMYVLQIYPHHISLPDPPVRWLSLSTSTARIMGLLNDCGGVLKPDCHPSRAKGSRLLQSVVNRSVHSLIEGEDG